MASLATPRVQLVDVDNYPRAVLSAALPRHANFPRSGITFVDVLPLFASPSVRAAALDALSAAARALPTPPTCVAGFEARGFLLIGVAERLGLPFVCLRKKGKLPGALTSVDYALEYGEATLQAAEGALPRGAAVLLVDDLLATGGTARAGAALVAAAGATVAALAVLVDITACGGTAACGAPAVLSLLSV